MATSEIIPFADSPSANIQGQAAYVAEPLRQSGNVPGIAKSAVNNKALLQATLMAAALGQFIANGQTVNITDQLDYADIATYMATAVAASSFPYVVATGTVNALVADFVPDLTVYNGRTIVVRAVGANTSATPTIAIDGGSAVTITKQGNNPLIPGDIKGAGHWLILTRDTVLGTWVLDNPATAQGATGGGNDKIFYENGQTVTQDYTIGATVNAGSFGDIAINVGVTVTIAPGGSWNIV